MAKKVENKKITISFERVGQNGLEELPVETTYFELIYGACKRPSNPQSGYSWDDIEKINRVKEYFEKSKDTKDVSVEDADISFIVERVKSNTWNTFDKTLLDFKKYIDKLV
jgi:hypothetical protein